MEERIWYVRAHNTAVDKHFVCRGKTFQDTLEHYESMLKMNREGQNNTDVRMCSISAKQLEPKPTEFTYHWEI